MNNITQLNRLTIQLKLYKDFMPLCPNNKVHKLSLEMNKLIARIDLLNQMDFNEMVKEVHATYETKQSKVNYL